MASLLAELRELPPLRSLTAADVEQLPELYEDIIDADFEEAPRRVLRDPGQPTKEEIEEHNVDHTPYRSWCPSCVRARAIGTPHRMRQDTQEVPVLGFDYLSATELQTAEAERPLGPSHGDAKVLVAHCQKTKCTEGHRRGPMRS